MKSKVHVALSAVLLLVGLVSNVGAAAAPAYANKQFPSASMTFTSTGFFHTAYEGGRWWLVTPDGHPFYSSGIDHVSSNPDTDQKTGQCPYCNTIATNYSSTSAWESAQVTRLRTWGFNTIGPFSDFSTFSAQMPYTDLLSMASGKDWFAPAFSANAQKIAQAQCAPLRNDPNLIGYFLDSEVHWGADWREQQPVLNDYLALPPGSPGLAVAQQYVGDPSGFLYALATRFFQVTTSAIRSVDPNHLILGVKAVAQLIQPQLLEAAAPYVDVWSVDDYQLVPQVTQFINSAWPYYLEGPNLLGKIENLIGKPLMIGEYSFRSSDSGLTNSWPPIYPTYASQGQRAAQYQQYVSQLYQDRYVVGDNWFEFVDEPYNGRFDGEDSNFGILSTSDIPYTTLVNRMKTMHALAPDQLAEPGARCLSWSAANSTPISNGSDVICTYSSQSGQANTNPATGGGYWTVDSIGLVSSFGSASNFGDASRIPLYAPIAAISGTVDGEGYWLLGADGGVFAFGDARYYGSPNVQNHSSLKFVAIGTDGDGKGYWVMDSLGQIFAYGDAQYYGGAATALNAAVSLGSSGTPGSFTSMCPTPDGLGYWLVDSLGQVFVFGDALYYGSIPAKATDSPSVVAIAAVPDGHGYWVVDSNGIIYAFGDAPVVSDGTAALFPGDPGISNGPRPFMAMAADPQGSGVWLASSNGLVSPLGGISTFPPGSPAASTSTTVGIAS